MPPLPVPPCRQSGASCMDPCYDALVGATTPTENKRVCQPAPRALEATDRHHSESFQGQANQWQGGTCHRKFRADEWRLPRVSPRQLPQRNRKDLDRAHKCTGTQVRRAKIPAVKRDTNQPAAMARCGDRGAAMTRSSPDWLVRRGLPPTREASEVARPGPGNRRF